MEQFDTPPTFESEQVQPTEMERLVDRMQNFSIGLTPATAQATLATVTRGLEQGMFKIEELDAIITIREEVNKGIIEYNGQMKQAQERMQVLQQEEVIKQQEEIANRIERERVKVRDERQLRKSTQDRLKLMEDALAKAGITIDLDGDGVIGLPAGEVATPLTQTEQQRVDQIVADTPAPTPAPKPTSGAFKLARMMNPSEEPVVPLDTPQSHTVIPSPVENLSDKEQFEEKIEEARKSFAEFVEPVELPVEPVNEDAIIRGASTEAFLDEVERVNEVADADQMDLSDDVPPTLVQESPQVAPPPAPSFVTGGNAPNITGIVGNTPNIKAQVEMDELDQVEQDLIDEEQFNQSFASEVDEPVIEEPTLDVGYEQPVLGENDVVIKSDQIKTIENYEDLEAEEEFEEVVIPNRADLEKMTKEQISSSATKLSFNVDSKLSKSIMIDTYETQANELIESLTEGNEFVSSTEEDLENGDEDRRDGGYF
jgi:hypothetical protein